MGVEERPLPKKYSRREALYLTAASIGLGLLAYKGRGIFLAETDSSLADDNFGEIFTRLKKNLNTNFELKNQPAGEPFLDSVAKRIVSGEAVYFISRNGSYLEKGRFLVLNDPEKKLGIFLLAQISREKGLPASDLVKTIFFDKLTGTILVFQFQTPLAGQNTLNNYFCPKSGKNALSQWEAGEGVLFTGYPSSPLSYNECFYLGQLVGGAELDIGATRNTAKFLEKHQGKVIISDLPSFPFVPGGIRFEHA